MVKITRPTKKNSYLRRRLFDQLDQMKDSQVIWISAPAGSGKTTLISSYIECCRLPCLWYQCDNEDGDPATFFYYMGLAAAKAAPGKRRLLPLFTPEYQQGISAFTKNYFEQLYPRLKNQSLIVFDNYQDISDASVFNDILNAAMTQLPTGINLIVLSRLEPPDVFIRLQANGKMAVIRWPDIRLTEEEAHSIIKARDKLLDSEKTIQNLYAMSDGWVAGLILMIEAVKNEPDQFNFKQIHSFNKIIAYFGQEVFQRLSAKMRDFFLHTAYVSKMTAAMARELTGEASAHDILQTLTRGNYFISRHGHIEPVFEYHPLYRDFLLLQAERLLSPSQLRSLQLKSASLLEQNGQTEAAIALLREIQDGQALTKLVLACAPDMLKQGRHQILREWLESLPADISDHNPWLLYFKGMSRMPFGPVSAQPFFEQAFQIFQKRKDDMGAVLAAAGMIQSIALGYDNFAPLDHWYEVIKKLTARVGTFPDQEIEASVVTSLIMAFTFREAFSVETQTWEERALKIPETTSTLIIKAHALHFIFWHRLIYGGAFEALALLNELRRLARLCQAQPLVSIIARAAEVQYYQHAGLHDELQEAARQGLDISRETGIHIQDMWFHMHLLGSLIIHMDYKEAKDVLNKNLPDAEGWPNWAKSLYHLLLMNMAFSRREYAGALIEGKQALDFAVRAASPLTIANLQMLLAQLLRTMGQHKEAWVYLREARMCADGNQGGNSLLIGLLMCEAQFALEDGDETGGLALLGRSLSLARECGYVSPFYDEPAITLRMCQKALEAGIEVDYVQHIIRMRRFVPEKPPLHLENWPWTVKIYTLGRFEILINDAPLHSQRKAQQAPLRLLKAMIAQGDRGVSTEQLADMLWPEAQGDAALHTLEITLQRLRKMLGCQDAVRLKEGRISLNDRYCWVDARAFERLLEQAQRCKEPAEASHKKELIEKAITLFKGGYFAGEHEEAWMIAPSERLKSGFFKSVWWLVRYLGEQGLWEQAADCCEKFLVVDDCREDIYRNLMVCYRNLGKKSEALLAYQRCCKVLSAVLGIKPSADTQALYSEILSEKVINLPHKS